MAKKIIDAVARESRVVSAARADLGKLLVAKDVRKLADADNELAAHISQVNDVLTEEEKAAAAWQKALATATKQWDASLAKLSKLHGDHVSQ